MRLKAKREPMLISAAGDGDSPAEILIYDDIGPSWLGLIGADRVKQKLDALGKISNLRVRINSYGGDVFEGTAIYNLFNTLEVEVEMIVDGVAASIASHILMSGDVIRMAANSRMMVHNARGIVYGQEKDFRHYADLLASIDSDLAATYAARSKTPVDEWAKLMDAETWITADDAVGHGFVDEVIERHAVAAFYDAPLHDYKHHPKDSAWKPEPVDWEAIKARYSTKPAPENAGGYDEPENPEPESPPERPRLAQARNMLKTFQR